MSTTITIEGSAEQQAQILSMLRSYGLINHANEITPMQAEAFDSYSEAQEEFIEYLHEELNNKGAELNESSDEERQDSQRVVDYPIANLKLPRPLEAEDSIIRSLSATIQERNANIDFVEAQVLLLEQTVSELHAALADTESQTKRVQEREAEMNAQQKQLRETEEEMEEMNANQKRLSGKILDLKIANSDLRFDRDFFKKRMELSKRRLMEIAKGGQEKRSWEGDDDGEEMDWKRLRIGSTC